MAGTCLIPVDQTYVNNLRAILESCHAELMLGYCTFKMIGKRANVEETLDNLITLSNIILYLELWDEAVNDCTFVHCAKELAMKICDFTEEDIAAGIITDAILQETVINQLIFLESGDVYIAIE